MTLDRRPRRATPARPMKVSGSRGAGFVWVSGLAFLSYLGVAVAAGRQDALQPGAVVLPEDAASITSGARPSQTRWIETRWSVASQGLASWYGPDFHGSPTASGEPYDMNGLTAAHRTLPLGSRALVRNLKNGRTVVVKINDRGPYHGRRVLDLSYGAARELGMLPAGTAKVEITPL